MAGGESGRILTDLEGVIQTRRQPPTAGGKPSYVRSLFEKGLPKIGAKIREEAEEVIAAGGEVESAGTDAAAAETARTHLCAEVADLVFHTMVLMGKYDLPIARVYRELERRFGTSGIEEKQSRTKS